jgi:hypothetical protein
MQDNAFRTNIEFMTLAFDQLASDGILREENFPGEYDRIIDTLLITTIYWVPFSRLKEEESPSSFSQQAWSILSLMLTDRGKIELQNTIYSKAL